MSYILDALKKSDQQRQHAKAPTLQSTHATPAPPRVSRVAVNVWWATALIGIGLLIGWWRPWVSEAPTTARSPNPASIPPVTTSPAAVVPPVKISTTLAVQAHPSTAAIGAIPAAAQPEENNIKATEKTAVPAVSAPLSASRPAPEIPLLQQHELPPEVQQTLPVIMIAFHQYSSQPDASRVMINNSVLHAGDLVAPGLKLEHITADGVILSYQGYRFQRGVR